jgi:uncharacterized damage-inducible protein DinB
MSPARKKRAKRKPTRPAGARRPGAKPRRAKRATTPRRKTARSSRATGRREAAAKPKRATSARRTARRAAPPRRKPKRAALKLIGTPRRGRPVPVRVVPVEPGLPESDVGSAKQRVIFELVRSRATVRASIQGLDADGAERPMGEGKWNVRQMVLHLCLRDRARIRELESTLRGVPHSWAGVSREEMDRMNAEDLAPLADVTWEEALRLLSSTRHALREALESVPDEPSEVWSPDHPFARMLLGLPPHDVHHAGIINRWRAEQGV